MWNVAVTFKEDLFKVLQNHSSLFRETVLNHFKKDFVAGNELIDLTIFSVDVMKHR